jgi:hypothetical protein
MCYGSSPADIEGGLTAAEFVSVSDLTGLLWMDSME